MLEFARWFRQIVPGCDQSYVAAVANRVGVRESARVVGRHTLTRDEILNPKPCEHAIAQAAFPIDIHEPDKPSLSHTEQLSRPFGIPYGCLIADGLDNLLLAGRCISSTHEANGSVRITATCFATGEAAGVAAAMAARQGVTASNVTVAGVRQRLRDRGAIVDAG
ncbi:MAG: FAD-dependent oxidoreductase [Acetobacteraceae bacterium]|nr:FAD-dependent oxidoreductase [Acetobacteraceae bacterium]